MKRMKEIKDGDVWNRVSGTWIECPKCGDMVLVRSDAKSCNKRACQKFVQRRDSIAGASQPLLKSP